MRIFLVSAFALASLTASAASAERPLQACRTIAGMLDAGLGNSGQPRRKSLLQTLASNSQGRLELSSWKTRGNQQAAYLHAAGVLLTPGQSVPATAKSGQIAAVMTSEGSASCTNVTLLESVGHRLLQMVPPYLVRTMSCSRWGDVMFLGRLDGQPFVAKESIQDTNIQVASWNGHAWASSCSVVVTYAPQLVSEGTFCLKGNCRRAESAARQAAMQFKADAAQQLSYMKGANSELDQLVKLAGQTLGTGIVPVPRDWDGINPAYLTPHLVRLDGHPTLAMVGEWKNGVSEESEPIGFAVGLWQQSGEGLKPVAGFHLRTARLKVLSAATTR